MPVEYGEPLSRRELEVVALVVEGLTNREIALRLYLSPNTVKVHLRNIFTKTGVASRTELSILAVKEGWVNIGPMTVAKKESPDEVEAIPSSEPQPQEVESVPQLAPRQWIALAIGLLLALTVLILPAPRTHEGDLPTGEGLVEPAGTNPVGTRPGETEWEELQPMPTRRARLGLTAAEGKLFTIGGLTELGPTAQMEIYDIEQGRWEEGPPRPLAAANVAAVALGGAIYVPGGCDGQGQPLADFHRYRIESGQWESLAPLPTPLCAYALTAWEGKLYLFGGWDGHAYRALTYVYDVESDHWKEGLAPTIARGFGAAAALDKRIYYVGGYDGHELNSCESYSPDEVRWEPCPSLLLPRGGLGLVAAEGHLYAVGGGWENYLGFNERFAPHAQAWAVIGSPMLGVWRNLGLALWEGDLYAVGGWNGDYLNRLYRMPILPFRIFIPITLP